MLYCKNKIAVKRHSGGYYDIYSSMCAWQNKPYLVTDDNGVPVGYISALGSSIAEIGAISEEAALKKVMSYLVNFNLSNITICIGPTLDAYVKYFVKYCESYNIAPTCHFKIVNWQKLCNALFGLKNQLTPLVDGSLIIEIQNYGKLLFCKDKNGAVCTLTDKRADIVLTQLQATSFILGPINTFENSTALSSAWFPLPLSWNLQDRI